MILKYAEAVARHGSQVKAATALGLNRSTFRNRLQAETAKAHKLKFATVPSSEEPIDKLIARRDEHYKRVKVHHEASTWQCVAVDDRQPIAVAFMGDPHIDDDGCAWDDLRRDVETIAKTPGMYGLNIGDTTNNWVGRLTREFGNQETSQSSARQLAEWLLVGAGIRWLAVILGNHDQWNEGGEIIKRMVRQSDVTIPVHEWAAKLELTFPNGATCRISAAHDFKGRSIYSANHGLKREAIWNQDGADVLVAGHIHYGEIGQCELPGGHAPWLVRVRGYKDFDGYALTNGYHEGRRFRSCVAIIDPDAEPHNRVAIFADVATGAKVLTAMRGEKPARAKRKRKAKR